MLMATVTVMIRNNHNKNHIDDTAQLLIRGILLYAARVHMAVQ